MSQLFNPPLGSPHDAPRPPRAEVTPRAAAAPAPVPPTMLPEANMSEATQDVMRLTSYRDPKGAVAAVKAAYVLLSHQAPGYVPSVQELTEKVLACWAPGPR